MTGPHPFPRRGVEPLPPPPGAFDVVVGRARARRHRRLSAVTGVTGVFLAGVVGGLTMGGGVSGVQQTIIDLANHGSTPAVTSPAPRTTTLAVGVPSASKHPRRQHTSTPVATPKPTPVPPVQPVLVRGRVVDGSGHAVAGLYVYTGTDSLTGFVPSSTAPTRTGSHGRYAVPCGGPVLLTSWPLNTRRGAAAPGRWAATVVSSPVCSGDRPPVVTTVGAGDTLTGRVSTDLGCAGTGLRLSLRLFGNPAATVRLDNLHEGAAYRISGLPTGTHVLAVRGQQTPVTVGRRPTTHDVTVACAPAVPTPTDTPTVSPSPAPTPDESVTPAPTVTSPTPTSSPSPTPSGAVSPL